ncbi:MAG: hypothetical protein IBJ18_13690 [Phycisphaerales bacterium]|nr:hypothetical protein [Phycisphaerales bacterium]
MAIVSVHVLRWVDDEPQPGVVEASLCDANNVEHRFVQKSAYFGPLDISRETAFPIRAVTDCQIIGKEHEIAGRTAVWIELCWCESTEQRTRFVVFTDQISKTD